MTRVLTWLRDHPWAAISATLAAIGAVLAIVLRRPAPVVLPLPDAQIARDEGKHEGAAEVLEEQAQTLGKQAEEEAKAAQPRPLPPIPKPKQVEEMLGEDFADLLNSLDR